MRLPEPLFFKGDNRGVLLLHAYSGSSNDVRMLARRLQEHNYSVFCPIFTGHGTGNPVDILEKGSVQQWQKDAEAGYRFLIEQRCHEISVFGLSLGGIFAMDLLARFSEIDSGGVFSSPIFQTADLRVQDAFITYATHQLASRDGDSDVALAEIQQALPGQLATIKYFAEQVVLENLGKIKQPVFIAQGGEDELIDPELAYRLSEQFEPRQTTFKWYPKAGHVITVNSAHHQLENDLIEFLRNNEGNK